MTKVWIQLIIYSSKCSSIKRCDCLEIINQELVKEAMRSNILIMGMNYVQTHFHFLIYLNDDLSISKTSEILKNITLVKLREENLVEHDFLWESNYLALSVSPSLVEKERQLIDSQIQIHQHTTLYQEIDMLLNEDAEKYSSF